MNEALKGLDIYYLSFDVHYETQTSSVPWGVFAVDAVLEKLIAGHVSCDQRYNRRSVPVDKSSYLVVTHAYAAIQRLHMVFLLHIRL